MTQHITHFGRPVMPFAPASRVLNPEGLTIAEMARRENAAMWRNNFPDRAWREKPREVKPIKPTYPPKRKTRSGEIYAAVLAAFDHHRRGKSVQIAAWAGVSPKQARAVINKLQNDGILTSERVSAFTSEMLYTVAAA